MAKVKNFKDHKSNNYKLTRDHATSHTTTINFTFLSICRYWYEYGNIYPAMISVWVALDKTTRTNSCLQVRH